MLEPLIEGMPLDLILVRHGQSEGNVAVKASKNGDDSHVLNPDFRQRHSSEWRLTDLGVTQAKTAGDWLRSEFGPDPVFDRYYTSSYTRAMETAALLDLPGASWYIDPHLRERERGTEDLLSSDERALLTESARIKDEAPLYWRPLNGESIMDTAMRVRSLCGTLHREMGGKRVIVVCHGEVMESFRVILERMTPQAFKDYSLSKDPADRINNCQVFHYTRRDPRNGTIHLHLNWWRSINTSNPSEGNPDWRPISRPVMDNQALLEMARQVPRLIPG